MIRNKFWKSDEVVGEQSKIVEDMLSARSVIDGKSMQQGEGK